MKLLFFFLLFFQCHAVLSQIDWLNLQGDSDDDHGSGLVIDSEGFIYVVGIFEGEMDADPGPGYELIQSSPSNKSNVFIQKFTSDQNLVWVKTLGEGGGIYEVNDVIIDGSDNIYLGGSFNLASDFSTGSSQQLLSPSSSSDGFVSKYTTNGDCVWAKAIGGFEIDILSDLALDQEGNIYMTGKFRETIDLDPGPGIASFYEGNSTGLQEFAGYLAKWDASGNYLWGQVYSATKYFQGEVEVNSVGDIFLTGSFVGTIDLDAGLGTNNFSRSERSMFTLKLDSARIFEWAKVTDGNNYDCLPGALTIDQDDNVYVAGNFVGEAILGYGSPAYNSISNGSWDMFIQKFNDNGTLLWSKSIGGKNSDLIHDLATNQDGQLYLTGDFKDSVLFNLNDSSVYTVAQSVDIFAMSWSQNGSFNWVQTFGGTCDYSRGYAIACDENQNVYGTGMYYGTIDHPVVGIIPWAGMEDCIIYKINGQLSIPSIDLEETIKLYPNPADEYLTIELQQITEPCALHVYNSMGQLLKVVIINSTISTVQTSSFTDGVYYLKLLDKAGRNYHTKKIILAH